MQDEKDICAAEQQAGISLSPEAQLRRAAALAERDKRLAQALRENLRRRKAQVRQRTAGSPGAGTRESEF